VHKSNSEVHEEEPVVRVIVPASQGLHFDEPAYAYERSGHGLQSAEVTDPALSLNVPGRQNVQYTPLR